MEAKEMQKIQDKKKTEGQNDLDSDRDTDGEEKKTEVGNIPRFITWMYKIKLFGKF